MTIKKLPSKYKPKSWNTLDEAYPGWNKLEQKKSIIKCVNVDRIKGTESCHRIDNWIPSKFFKIKKWLEDKEYDLNYECPPTLFEINNDLFVTTDGYNRVLVFKHLKIRKMKAEVINLI
ncbi:hypothetical protein CL617_01510 [archaeon]|nr:hypothetical protein [archaeon]|tara:strand:- start:995 stop:1351 length:357 start_codon:yes stop_codon:yes gene_type:complete